MEKYCCIGDIQCGNYLGLEGHNVNCNFELVHDSNEVCPFPERQQPVEPQADEYNASKVIAEFHNKAMKKSSKMDKPKFDGWYLLELKNKLDAAFAAGRTAALKDAKEAVGNCSHTWMRQIDLSEALAAIERLVK